MFILKVNRRTNREVITLKKKKVVIGFLVGLISVILIVGVMKVNQKSELVPEMEPQDTYVIPTQKKVILSGSVVPSQFKTFAKDISKGEEVVINVKHGDSVQEGDILITYHNPEITDQIKDLNEQIESLNTKKSKLSQEGTPAAKSINKQIKSVEDQKSKLEQETKNQVNQILKKLESLVKQKSELDIQDENYEALVAEIDAQIESYYVQKNDLEYNLPDQIATFDEQISDLRSQLNDEDQETFNALDEQINNLVKELKKLEEKEYIKEVAPFSGVVSLVEDSSEENPVLLKLKSPDFYVTSSVGEKDYAKLKVGMESQTLIIATNKIVNGKITFIDEDPMQTTNASGVSESSTYAVKVSLDDQSELVNGYQAQVSLKLDDQLISIPTEAIISEDNNHYVYVLKDGEFVQQKVDLAGEEDGYTKIKFGLNEKDEILINPSEDTKEGETIE